MPYDLAVWQIIGCGLMVIILSGLVIYKLADNLGWVPLVSFFTAWGFAIAFAAGFSYGISSQEGVGIFLALIGVGMGTTVTNLAFGAITLKKKSLP
ncbi:hypothetical protein [Corynebacterium caspium]|uniref:hypothetical protein n=1 Tax=Corynebacterium caspium TaxID=234828 RepID=UPI0003780B82|nr:hypothetical protein [Corynebacterium caspium]WKD58525.1 hypothetical protein CCASP_00465 [Corynebacterium caspium DSM 44850]